MFNFSAFSKKKSINLFAFGPADNQTLFVGFSFATIYPNRSTFLILMSNPPKYIDGPKLQI
jgi:hypothetical protein